MERQELTNIVSKGRTPWSGVRYTRKKLPLALHKGEVERDPWDMSSPETPSLGRHFLGRIQSNRILSACPHVRPASPALASLTIHRNRITQALHILCLIFLDTQPHFSYLFPIKKRVLITTLNVLPAKSKVFATLKRR
jgi:hypothetical protein